MYKEYVQEEEDPTQNLGEEEMQQWFVFTGFGSYLFLNNYP